MYASYQAEEKCSKVDVQQTSGVCLYVPVLVCMHVCVQRSIFWWDLHQMDTNWPIRCHFATQLSSGEIMEIILKQTGAAI